jgi:8-oxo-dGTP pyrophosphatase MutT (NUDIX family)
MSDITVRPASTVVLLRDGRSQDGAGNAGTDLEVLLVRRNRALAFAGGFWVFPGGAVDDEDRKRAADDDREAARIAAAREAEEEAGIAPDPGGMVLISHWTTPVGERKRFATWFFAAAVPEHSEVRIDEDEIHDWRWVRVVDALREHRAGALPMLPPTYITLCALERYPDAQAALAGERESPCPRVLPRMIPAAGEGGFATLYPGDVAYDSGNGDAVGARHRSVLDGGCWHYVYDDGVTEAPLYPLVR